MMPLPDPGTIEVTAPSQSGVRRALRSIRAMVETVILGFVFYLLISSFVLQPFRVEQTSMLPTVQPGEYVLVDKLFGGALGYHRGDIVVLHIPETYTSEPLAPLIKRVVATGGERLQIHDGAVFIDGVKLAEPYLPAGTQTTLQDGTTLDMVIPAGSLWVMGDHRDASTDSRMFGPVLIDHVVGHAILRYWPLDRFAPLGVDPASGSIPVE
jgi:signal peptidase I